jgi:GT2 family glycosyltransferase
MATLSVIVVSYNTADVTLRCLHSVNRAVGTRPAEVWLVDNASQDGTAPRVRQELPQTRLICNETNRGYGAAANQAMRQASGDAFLLLNSDAEISAAALRGMLEALERDPLLAAVGARLVGADGRPRPSARRFPAPLRELLERFMLYRLLPRRVRSRFLLGDHALPEHARTPDWVTGACLLVRRTAFLQTGGFDETIFLYGEELEWCARLRRGGWRIGLEPEVEVVHEGRASSGPLLGLRRLELSLEGDLRYLARYRSRAILAGFVLARGIGLIFQATLAGLGRDRSAWNTAIYELRAHAAQAWRYTFGQARPAR